MSEGLNRVMLLGNLCADPELRFTQGGKAVLNLRLATNESYLDKDRVRKERVDYHSVTIWDKRGEALSKILNKGSSILVEGSIRTSSYEDKEGQKRYKTEIVATNVVLTGKGGGGERGDSDSGVVSKPAGARGFGGKPAAPANGPPDDFNYGSDDDVPFN